MFSIVNDQLIGSTEIRVLGLAFLLWVSMYSINWVCANIYNAGYDIFNIFKKKKKSRRRS